MIKKLKNIKYQIYRFIYLIKHYFFNRFNKKIIKFRKIKKMKSPIFLFENRLKVYQYYFSSLFSGCSIFKVEYKIDESKDDDFKLILSKLIEIFKENLSKFWNWVKQVFDKFINFISVFIKRIIAKILEITMRFQKKKFSLSKI